MTKSPFIVATFLLALSGGSSLAQTTQVTIPASPIFQASNSFYELHAADVDTGTFGRGWYEWQTPRGLVVLGRYDGVPFIDGFRRSFDGSIDLLVANPGLAGGSPFPFAQFFSSGGPVNGLSCRIGAQADQWGGPLIDSVITATFDDGYSYSFPVSAGGLTYVGFCRPDGPEIHSVTFTASVGLTAINTFGIGTVPSPAAAFLLTLGGLVTASRRRR